VLLLVRHGETAANVEGLLLGRADPPLTERGRSQARAVAAALPAPTRLISSPLQRARDTAAAFTQSVEIDERWIELDYGALDRQPASALTAADWARWRADPAFVPEGGESLTALGDRVRAACADVAKAAAGGVVVVVTHVSPIKAAVAWALGVSDAIAWRMFVEDASVTRIDTRPDGPVLRWFNRLPPVAEGR
jgi:broad specificity phosphatase PhoE